MIPMPSHNGAGRLPPSTATVVIATYNRPDYVRVCLEHLFRQTVAPERLVVVDASPDRRTREVVAEFPGVIYLRNERGAGSTATSRAIGVRDATSEVIGFVDDDAYAEPDWLEHLLLRYADPSVAAVGGRALNGQPGEEREGLDRIGHFLPNGRLTGNFAADPGRDIDVDHLLGANMSVRRSAMEAVGGIHDHYPGTCLREETDIALRLRASGYRIVYTPSAVVRHVAGPYAKGRRFDLRYSYYGQRNHLVLLARTVGTSSAEFHRYLGVACRDVGGELVYAARALGRMLPGRSGSVVRGVGNGVLRAGAMVGGLASGLAAAATLQARFGAPEVASAPTLPDAPELRLAAYVLAGDPSWIPASIASYYHLVERIVVSYDETGRSWSGQELLVDESLRRLRESDPENKMVFLPGAHADSARFPLDTETEQRQAALDAASEGADWVIQLDTDEIVVDPDALRHAILTAEARGFDAVDFPLRNIDQVAGKSPGKFLEICGRWWTDQAAYPGPVAVRTGTRLDHCRQAEVPTYRVDLRAANTDPWHPRDAIVHAVVPRDSAVVHMTGVRTDEQMERKSRTSGHAKARPWALILRKWRWRRRHPRLAVALTPLRRDPFSRFRVVSVELPPELDDSRPRAG